MLSSFVFFIVILSAGFHAFWNTLVKGGADKKAVMACVVFGQVPFALVALLVVPLPALESWPYILSGAALHFAYQLFLLNAYRFGDLTQVYPIARGSAPLFVTLVSVIFLAASLGQSEIWGVVLIALGIFSLVVIRQDQRAAVEGKALALALATGAMIASYSLVDGTGARLAQTSLGYYSWLCIFNAGLMAFYIFNSKRRDAQHNLRSIKPAIAMAGGAGSFISYALITWAFTQAPIALVAALRETSVIFVLLIGVFILKERMTFAKLLAIMLTFAGVIVLKWI